MKYKVFNIILLVCLTALLAGAAWSGYRVQQLARVREEVKEDYSLSNSATFGLFSVDAWRDKLSDILHGQVHDYHITPEQKKQIYRAVEKELHGLVSKTVAEINAPKKGLGNKLKKWAFNALVDSDDLQKQVPPFAKTIVNEVTSPESQDRLKGIASSKITQLVKQTYDSTSTANYKVTQYLYKKYHASNPEMYNERIKDSLANIKAESIKLVCIMLGCVLLGLILWWLMRKEVKLQTPLFVYALAFALLMLALGSLVPVIEVDARIKTLDLGLMGDSIHFQDQVLFYQSKSIVGIVTTLIDQQKPDAIAVGILVMLFVLILPLVRLIAKGIHILSPKKIATHPALHYLTFESGKWDMADVMIVGMLMTYIGLNGILKSQLKVLNIHSGALNVVTENGNSLQPGYFIFAGYVLFALLLSYILKRISPHQNQSVVK